MSNPVVTHQPGAGGYGTNVQTGEWSTGLCSCFSDLLICEYNSRCLFLTILHPELSPSNNHNYILFYHAGAIGCICPVALSCYTANKYGENCCLGCVPGGITAMRTHMRLTYGIQVGLCYISLISWVVTLRKSDLFSVTWLL